MSRASRKLSWDSASQDEYAFPFEAVSPMSLAQFTPLIVSEEKNDVLMATCAPVESANCRVVCRIVSMGRPAKPGFDPIGRGSGPTGVTRKLNPGALRSISAIYMLIGRKYGESCAVRTSWVRRTPRKGWVIT